MNNKKSKQSKPITLFTPFADENGAVLIITVIILFLLTLLGISGINTASTDMQITNNYRIHNLNLACADAAVNTAISHIAYRYATTADAWVQEIKALYEYNENGVIAGKYFKANTDWEQAKAPLNVLNVEKIKKDWDKGYDVIKPTTMPDDPDVEYVVYVNTISTTNTDGESVVIARSRKNGGDVVIEAGFNQK